LARCFKFEWDLVPSPPYEVPFFFPISFLSPRPQQAFLLFPFTLRSTFVLSAPSPPPLLTPIKQRGFLGFASVPRKLKGLLAGKGALTMGLFSFVVEPNQPPVELRRKAVSLLRITPFHPKVPVGSPFRDGMKAESPFPPPEDCARRPLGG